RGCAVRGRAARVAARIRTRARRRTDGAAARRGPGAPAAAGRPDPRERPARAPLRLRTRARRGPAVAEGAARGDLGRPGAPARVAVDAARELARSAATG